MHQTLHSLGQHVHPDKTFIGKVERGFDFLGIQFQAGSQRLSNVSMARLNLQLTQKFTSAARLYEQGRLHSLEKIELYLTHWLRWSKGIGIAASSALDTLQKVIKSKCQTLANVNVMFPIFANSLLRWIEKQNNNQLNRNNNYENIKQNNSPSRHSNHIRFARRGSECCCYLFHR